MGDIKIRNERIYLNMNVFIKVNDVCLIDIGDVFFIDFINKLINYFFMDKYNSVFLLFSIVLLIFYGIC